MAYHRFPELDSEQIGALALEFRHESHDLQGVHQRFYNIQPFIQAIYSQYISSSLSNASFGIFFSQYS
jgi:hypothetical protein